jgi:acyl-lipid omega-6 desaturase (Delta-12 desaturase)
MGADSAFELDRKAAVRRYAQHCSAYRRPSLWKSSFQIGSTLLPLLALAALIVWLANQAPWLAVALTLPLGGLVVRCFIIQHDCGHGSYFTSRTANDAVGRAMSLITFTPYMLWRRAHAQHHATSGNLDKRGAGDIKTLTVSEYLALDRFARFRYRIYRNPAFLFLVGVPGFFMILQRLPWGHPLSPRECWKSVVGLDLAILFVFGLLAAMIGLKALVILVVPTLIVASVIGGWLFFIQHQFENTLWDEKKEWDFQVAAVHGSSFYDLPAVLRWFTGNIGFHHIHHLNSMVPNYRLQECMADLPELATINRMTFLDSLKCARLTLWDEETRTMIRFNQLQA